MYENIVNSLRYCAENDCSPKCPRAGIGKGCIAGLKREAADAIEELSRAADAIPHVCECCIGCEVESGGCDYAFVLSPKRAKEYLSKPRWIPVTEQLPEVGQRVMAVGLHGEAMYIGTYTGGIKETDYRKAKPYKIIAHGYGWRTFTWWMPLPEPPKEE